MLRTQWSPSQASGVNLAYMRTHSTGVGTNSEFGSILGSALYLSPILTPTLTGDAAEKMLETYKDFDLPRDANGDPYTVPVSYTHLDVYKRQR